MYYSCPVHLCFNYVLDVLFYFIRTNYGSKRLKNARYFVMLTETSTAALILLCKLLKKCFAYGIILVVQYVGVFIFIYKYYAVSVQC